MSAATRPRLSRSCGAVKPELHVERGLVLICSFVQYKSPVEPFTPHSVPCLVVNFNKPIFVPEPAE